MTERRLFLSLWPNATIRQRLADAGRQLHGALGGRPSKPEGLHLTLAFLGETPESQIEPLIAALAEVQAEPMTLTFDRFGYWQSGIGWLAPAQESAPLMALSAEIRKALQGCRVRYDRKAFKPHITLIRKALPGRMPVLEAPIVWHAHDFHLVESCAQSYCCLQKFSF